MGKKSSNEARMLGIIPSLGADPIPVGKIPDGATQIATYSQANNSTTSIRTVASGKTLYLSSVTISVSNGSGGVLVAAMLVTNAADATQYYLSSFFVPDSDGKIDSNQFLPPLEIQAGWKIKVYSSAVGGIVTGFIHGYEA